MNIKDRVLLLTRELRVLDQSKLLILQFLIIFLVVTEAGVISLVSETVKYLLDKENSVTFILSVIFEENEILTIKKVHIVMVVSMVVVMGSAFSTYATWKIASFSTTYGAHLANILYDQLARIRYREYIDLDQADVTRTLTFEIKRVTQGIVLPTLNLISKIILIIGLVILLTISISVWVLIVFLPIVVMYIIVFYGLKNIIKTNGKKISNATETRVGLITDYFSAFKVLKVSGNSSFLTTVFFNNSLNLEKANAQNIALSVIPRYFIETLLILVIISSIFYITNGSSDSLVDMLPDLTLLALLALKLSGAVQQAYYNASLLVANYSALVNVTNLISRLQGKTEENLKVSIRLPRVLELERAIYYHTDDESDSGLKFNISISKGEKIAIIGPSGSGKTTLALILCGLILPKSAKLTFDGTDVDIGSLGNLRNDVSFLPQDYFVTTASLWSNITLEREIQNVDMVKLDLAIDKANLTSFIDAKKEGIHATIKPSTLSGGQKQRIALARLFYFERNLVILDEPTSALDHMNAHTIIDEIVKDNGLTVVCITHDSELAKKFERVVEIEKGEG